jgi:hypothetical protein
VVDEKRRTGLVGLRQLSNDAAYPVGASGGRSGLLRGRLALREIWFSTGAGEEKEQHQESGSLISRDLSH